MKTWLLNVVSQYEVRSSGCTILMPSYGLPFSCSQFLPVGQIIGSPGQEFYIEITSAVTSHPEISAYVGEKKEATVVPRRSKLGLDTSRMFKNA